MARIAVKDKKKMTRGEAPGQFPKLTIDEYQACGGFSLYFELGRGLGIKVIHVYYEDDDGLDDCHAGLCFPCPTSPEECRKTRLWKEAEREYRLLKKAQHLHYVPRVYQLMPICITNFLTVKLDRDEDQDVWFPGIVMEHIDGEFLYDVYASGQMGAARRDAIVSQILGQARKDGLTLKDHYYGSNILVKADRRFNPPKITRWWVIDFTPGHVRVVKRRKNGKKN